MVYYRERRGRAVHVPHCVCGFGRTENLRDRGSSIGMHGGLARPRWGARKGWRTCTLALWSNNSTVSEDRYLLCTSIITTVLAADFSAAHSHQSPGTATERSLRAARHREDLDLRSLCPSLQIPALGCSLP